MQIHELTQRRKIDEGFMDQLKLAGKAFNDPSIMTSNSKFATAQADMKLQTATQNLIKKLSGEWAQISKSIPAPAAADIAARSKVKLPKPPPVAPIQSKFARRPKPGQMPAAVASSKTGQQMKQMLGTPKGGIQGMQSDLEEAFADLPGGPAPAPATKAAQIAKYKAAKGSAAGLAARNTYRTAFLDWANKKISTKEQTTGTPIDIGIISQDPKIKSQLDQQLSAIVSSQQDPAANQAAVESYLMTAITAMQNKAKEVRDPAGGRGKTIPSTGNPQADKDLKALGYTVI
jgi:hypothetical protein